MGLSFRITLGAAVGILVLAGAAHAQGYPPSQAGRLAFTEGTVSFHDDEQVGWSPAVINTPLTSGDSLWTEPNARSELSIAGTRVRMEGGTQLNMLSVDDSQTRLQVGQGRIDIKTYSLNPNTPYQVVTPRGTISLRQQGDYYVEAGSTQDATRLGVRSGAAQIQGLNGQTLTVNPGQVGEIYGDTGALGLRTINGAPPAQPAYWSARDRQINYDLPTQYLSAGITGYEDLNSYGSWSNDSQYGNVWTPRSVPSGWQPYKNGHWSYVKPWGWTWIDDQPWGYASSHYGRWANRTNQWVWVPPQREAQQVYAPALVAFIGGLELVQALLGGNASPGYQDSAPVGWFPLGPREAYVPSYTTDRAYYGRLNTTNQVQQQILEDRWQRAQRREAYIASQNAVLANQRFATVVPAQVFVGSQPVARAALPVSAAQVAAAPVAPVSAPPAPTAQITRLAPASAPATRPADPAAATPVPDPKAATDAKASLPVARTAVADMPTLARPATTTKLAAPGPKLATAPSTPAPTTNTQGEAVAPPLVPRIGVAPPILKDDSKVRGLPGPGHPEARAPAAIDTRVPTAPDATAPTPARPERVKPAEPPTAATPGSDRRPPDKGAAVTPQRAAPAAEAPRPAPPPGEQKQVVPNVMPAPAVQPTAPPPHLATPAVQQHSAPALAAPIAPPPVAPPPVAASTATPPAPPPTDKAAPAAHEEKKAHTNPNASPPGDEEKKGGEK